MIIEGDTVVVFLDTQLKKLNGEKIYLEEYKATIREMTSEISSYIRLVKIKDSIINSQNRTIESRDNLIKNHKKLIVDYRNSMNSNKDAVKSLKQKNIILSGLVGLLAGAVIFSVVSK